MSAAKRTEPLVGWWLLIVCACVFAMVMVGGATRLTDSGLSITEWNIGKGLTPPLTEARWAEEFALYRRTIEYQLQNQGMSLAEFQRIYWWEWAHRFLGKMIGVVFAGPFAAFWLQGRLRGRFPQMLVLFALGALQGFIGWWMVTSGLWSDLDVSPLRLAVHLGLAFMILALGFWMALDAFGWPRGAGKLGAPKALLLTLIAALFVQVELGALLAGSRGGAAYADWPTIGGEWIPSSYAALDPFWRNFVENHAAQHVNHRTLGYVIVALALTLAALAWRGGQGAPRKVAIAVGALAVAQASLGVVTVLSAAHLHSSLTHQAVAAVLWLTLIAGARAAYYNTATVSSGN